MAADCMCIENMCDDEGYLDEAVLLESCESKRGVLQAQSDKGFV